ncbi:hypothetical protein AB0O31_13835 [Kitasatospora cineracea]|uniref:hypothetical protein n=1 Tax=Kitasatospora cineracea TaxID=88074 RepID=UPI00341C2691
MSVLPSDRRYRAVVLSTAGALVLAVLVALAVLLPGKDTSPTAAAGAPSPSATDSASASPADPPPATTTPSPTATATPEPTATPTDDTGTGTGSTGTDDGTGWTGWTGSTGSSGGRSGGNSAVQVGNPGSSGNSGNSGNSGTPGNSGSTPTPAPTPTPTPGPTPTPTPTTTPTQTPTPTPSPSASGACPAVLAPHTVVSCRIAPNTDTAFTLRLPKADDLVIVQLVTPLYGTPPRLYAPDGTRMPCEVSPDYGFGGPARCTGGPAGDYTLRVNSHSADPVRISLSYLPVLSSDDCVTVSAADRTLGSPTVYSGAVPAGLAGNCYTADFAPGERVRLLHPDDGRYVDATLFDGAGKAVCRTTGSAYLDCALTGTGPYRAVVQHGDGVEGTYQLALSRFSQPQGCPVVQPQGYGEDAALADTARCRILRVPADGHYSYRGLYPDGVASGHVYTADGTEVCKTGDCDLTAGDYTYTVRPDIRQPANGVVLRSATETRGCTPVRDDQLTSGSAVDSFGAIGQDRCLTLPTAAGEAVYLMNRTPEGGTSVAPAVLDATGAVKCAASYADQLCRLSGTGPFRVVMTSNRQADFRLVVQRLGDTSTCAPWAASAYGNGKSQPGTVSAVGRMACLTVPADHPARELVGYRLGGASLVNSSLRLVDASGRETCRIFSGAAGVCTTPTGAYTAVLFSDQDFSDFTVARRDATASAVCDLAEPSGQVGGRAVEAGFESATDAHCVPFTPVAGDLFQIGSRHGIGGQATMMNVVDAAGGLVCQGWGPSCRVAGTGRHLVVLTPYSQVSAMPKPALDIWKLATAAGWAPECAGHQVSVDAFPERTGTLTDTDTVYCAVLDMKAGQDLKINLHADTGNPDDQLMLAMAGRENWSDQTNPYKCVSSGIDSYTCAYSGAGTGHAVLLFGPGTAKTPLDYTIGGTRAGTGIERSGIPRTLTPNSAPTDTQTEVTIEGTGLSMSSRFHFLMPSERVTPLRVVPLSAAPDGTSLTVRIDSEGVSPGVYDLLVDGVTGYKYGVPSPGYIPKAFTVLAPAAVK